MHGYIYTTKYSPGKGRRVSHRSYPRCVPGEGRGVPNHNLAGVEYGAAISPVRALSNVKHGQAVWEN